jgi:hypothetical protein
MKMLMMGTNISKIIMEHSFKHDIEYGISIYGVMGQSVENYTVGIFEAIFRRSFLSINDISSAIIGKWTHIKCLDDSFVYESPTRFGTIKDNDGPWIENRIRCWKKEEVLEGDLIIILWAKYPNGEYFPLAPKLLKISNITNDTFLMDYTFYTNGVESIIYIHI